jgi:hypothetical protein
MTTYITAARKEATYARELIRQLLAATDPAEKEAIANELQASVIQVASYMGAPSYK